MTIAPICAIGFAVWKKQDYGNPMKLIQRHMLPAWPNNPVSHCKLYERIAPLYNHVRSNNPNFLHNVRAQRGATCYITTERLAKQNGQAKQNPT